jgi:hypothetical protein
VAGGCASTQGSSPAALAAPANYRQLVAAKIREMEDVSALQAVEISRPRERFVGLINGGTRPAVCVRVVRPNIFGASAAWYYFFYFENGKADGYKFVPTNLIERAMYPCDDPLTPITPLVRSRR